MNLLGDKHSHLSECKVRLLVGVGIGSKMVKAEVALKLEMLKLASTQPTESLCNGSEGNKRFSVVIGRAFFFSPRYPSIDDSVGCQRRRTILHAAMEKVHARANTT